MPVSVLVNHFFSYNPLSLSSRLITTREHSFLILPVAFAIQGHRQAPLSLVGLATFKI
jgi:hypothetical protein